MAREEGKRKLTGFLAALGKYKYVLLVAALGALLMAWPAGRKEAEPDGAAPPAGSPPWRRSWGRSAAWDG